MLSFIPAPAPKATTADAQALTDNTKVMTPAQTKVAVVALLTGLPTTLPATPGILWNNGGLLSVS